MAWRTREEVVGILSDWLIGPMEGLSHMPQVYVDAAEATWIRNGRQPRGSVEQFDDGCRVALVCDGNLVAVAEMADSSLRLLRVIPAN